MKSKFPRPAISFIGQNLKGPLVGVEIGVYRGENAESMLQTLNIEKLYLVDPYLHYSEYKCKLPPDFLGHHRLAQRRLHKFKDKIVWVRKKSADAVSEIPDDIDFVYIDAGHDEVDIKQDINSWLPKIKQGGWIGGHDYQYDVERVVNQYFKNSVEQIKNNTWLVR